MRILVVGGTGYSGPHVVRRLLDMGHEIALFHRGLTDGGLPADVRHIQGDRERLLEFAGELRRFAPEIVLDMIPFTEGDATSLMDVFADVARRVVAISSQDVYRAYGRLIGLEPGPIEPAPLTEKSPLRQKLYPYRERVDENHRLYHYDKILVEQLFMGNPGIPGTILRYPMVYGPRDRQHRLFPYLKRMEDGRRAILLEEGMAAWRWTRGYVENVAEAVALAVTDERASGRIYNVGEEEALSESEWVRAIGQAAGWRGEVVVMPEGWMPEHLVADMNTAQHLVVDTGRIRKELGYREVVSRAEALRRTVSWERANPPKEADPNSFDYAAEDDSLQQWEN